MKPKSPYTLANAEEQIRHILGWKKRDYVQERDDMAKEIASLRVRVERLERHASRGEQVTPVKAEAESVERFIELIKTKISERFTK